MLNLGLTVLLILVIIPGGVVGATDIDIATTLNGIWAAVGGQGPDALGWFQGAPVIFGYPEAGPRRAGVVHHYSSPRSGRLVPWRWRTAA